MSTETLNVLDRVNITIQDGIAYICLNRADKLNALDMDMFKAIKKSAKIVKKNREIRGVILHGEGKAFCSGIDVKSMFSNPMLAAKLLVKPGTKASNLAQDVSVLWREVPVPVIAVTHGKCWGGGMQIALGADFRYSSQDCSFSIMESRWGLIPDMGGSIALRELMPIDVAKEITMSAKVLNAEEAKAINLITKTCDNPMADAIEFLNELKEKSPDAIQYTKQLYQGSWLGTIRNALNLETKLQKRIIGRFNQRASVKRNQSPDADIEYKPRRAN